MEYVSNFTQVSDIFKHRFKSSKRVHTERWQGIDISKRPEAEMHELMFESFLVELPTEDLAYYRHDIKPNLPWADDHFLERVSGEPLNPGEQWANWPWAQSAKNFIYKDVFSHTYMERYWPKHAGGMPGHFGIRYPYGDLLDVVQLLVEEPLTRQAYLPVWFPEDTGVIHRDRKPCTLGYHFIVREGRLHVVYYIRSCDFIRHFADDCYLTVRLLLWILDECRRRTTFWDSVQPGDYVMHITSLHMFRNDHIKLFGGG